MPTERHSTKSKLPFYIAIIGLISIAFFTFVSYIQSSSERPYSRMDVTSNVENALYNSDSSLLMQLEEDEYKPYLFQYGTHVPIALKELRQLRLNNNSYIEKFMANNGAKISNESQGTLNLEKNGMNSSLKVNSGNQDTPGVSISINGQKTTLEPDQHFSESITTESGKTTISIDSDSTNSDSDVRMRVRMKSKVDQND